MVPLSIASVSSACCAPEEKGDCCGSDGTSCGCDASLMTIGSVAAVLLLLAWSQVTTILGFYLVWAGIGLGRFSSG